MARQATAALTGGKGFEGRVSGYVFKVIRESVGQTQEQLAEHLGMGLATIQGWESGRRSLMATPTGNFLTLRTRLRRLGADANLLDSLTLGLEADLFIGQILATAHPLADPK